jgi:N-acetylmuramoyl-L-alanine amidase
MKKSRVVGFVTGAHVVAFGGLLLTQGCGTTRAPLPRDEEFVMPPRFEEEQLAPPVPVAPVYRPAPMPPVVTAPPVTVQPVTVTAPADTTPYVVQKGDSLSVIARRYGISVQDVMRLNNISDPNVIRVGQRLLLPGKINLDQPRSATPSREAVTSAASGTGERYVVQVGDSLSVVAQRHRVTVQSLMKANNITDANRIRVGQELVIPAEGRRPAAAATSTSAAAAPVRPAPAAAARPVAAPVAPVAIADSAATTGLPLAPAVQGSQHTYTVQIGDDLLSVASEFNVSIAALRAANKLDSDILVPGRVLVIPAVD